MLSIVGVKKAGNPIGFILRMYSSMTDYIVFLVLWAGEVILIH